MHLSIEHAKIEHQTKAESIRFMDDGYLEALQICNCKCIFVNF
jgi:hypothetical protein